MQKPDQKYKVRYRELSILHGMTDKQMADALGLKMPYYRLILSNTKVPGLPVLLKTAKLFETNLSYILGETRISQACERYEVNNRIEQIRQMRGYSRSQLAKKSNISAPTLSSYETQPKYIGPVKTLSLIAHGLDVSIDYMLGLTDTVFWESIPFMQIDAGCPGFMITDNSERYFLMSESKDYIIFANGETVSFSDLDLRNASIKHVYREV